MAVLIGGLLMASQGWAQTLTFEGLQNLEPIENYYNGGLGGFGSGPGPNYGISFGSDALAIIQDSAGGSGNFANNPSGVTTAFFLTGPGDVMNVPAGFNTGFSFYYSSISLPGEVDVYSGQNDTGTLLASLTLPVTPEITPAPDGGLEYFDNWAAIGVSFSGTAESVDFTGTANEIGFDNVTLNSSRPAGPLTWNNAGGASPSDGRTWDIGTNNNWNNGFAATVYTDGSNVLFNDNNNRNYAVTLNTTVSPASVTVDNSSGDYTISGTGSIVDSGSFVKSGSRMLTIGTALSADSISVTGGSLQLVGGTVTAGALTVDNGSLLRISAGSLSVSGTGYVGDTGTGNFNQTGGMATFSGSDTNGNGLTIGTNSGSTGTYTLSGGTLTVSYNETVGNYYGAGTFNQTGGTNTVSSGQSLFVSGAAGSTGIYNLSGTGSLSVGDSEVVGNYYGTGTFNQTGGTNTASTEFVGNVGTGTYNQSGGTNTITSGNSLWLGDLSGWTGTYTLSGDGALSAGNEFVGNSGTGIFNQTGGTNTISSGNSLFLGNVSGSNGAYSLSGDGVLSSGNEFVGNDGTGTFNQTGGTNTISAYSWLYVGNSSGSTGTYTLGGTASLSVLTGHEDVGYYGTGTFIQTGGTNTINGGGYYNNPLTLGYATGVTGSYNLSGSSSVLSVTGNELVGYSGTGIFTQTGGSNTVTGTLDLAANAGSSGTYNLQGGTLTAGAIVVNTGGTFYAGGAGFPVVISLTGTQPFENQGLTDIGIGDPILNGNYTQTSTGETLFDLGGPDPNVGYGQLTVYGTVDLSGIIETDYFNGFYPTIGETFDLIVASDGITFDTGWAGMPEEPGFTYALVNGDQGDTIFQATFVGVVPEPVTGSLLLIAGAGMLMRRRRSQLA
ncbi:MAG: PEP-CTERM sorting domain-containing protein [Tepidisphaeraceae bacterium]